MTDRKKPPSGPARFNPSVFTEALAKAVASERAGQEHGAVSAVLRRAVPDARVGAIQYADRGDKIALQLSRSVDVMTQRLFDHAAASDTDIALCAIGGYGRCELAPFSDIDLLFLHNDRADSDIHQALNFMLYPLWDSGMKIGHGVHTPKSAVAFAKEDMVARTAYLDVRFLAGSRDTFNSFKDGYDKLRKRTRAQFVAAKLQEQAERQRAAGETRYLVEPDIKEGKGGLRDVQTIRWIYGYVYDGVIGESPKIDKILGEREVRDLVKAERFLWSVRAHLHDLRGRADERLAFDIQPDVAERLGYHDRRAMTPAERLMRHYFVTAVETGRLTRILCARLEEESTKRLPHFPRLLPKKLQTDEASGKPNVCIRNGRLDFESAKRATNRPTDFFRLFRAFSKNTKIDFHPAALAVVSENAVSVTSKIRKDPTIAALFKGILESNVNPVRTLRVMTETGLLGKYIPVFGEITGRIHYGLYRHYTLDEHVLRALDVLRQIRSGMLEDDHPVSTMIVKHAANPYLITLAVFLHESVWTVKDKSVEECERLVRRVTIRLGLSNDEASLCAWGVAHYSMMIRTAERRNLTDAQAIAQFAERVGSKERLDLIVVMSTCHLRVVGHHSWDDVIRRQLLELHSSACAWFEHGEEGLTAKLAKRAQLAREEARTRLADWSDDEKDAFLARLTDDMLSCVDAEIIVRFAYLARAAERDEADAAVTVTPREGDLECIIYADDRPGLLADIAGAVAGAGFSVRSVQALTTADDRAFDIFSVQSADGMPVDDPNVARRLHNALLESAKSPPESPPNLKRRLGDRRSIFEIEPAVRVELDASKDATVVEAEGLDRPGLLYEMAAALGELGVSIASAHIATYGERAVDAFYLTGPQRTKITDPKRLKKIEECLLNALHAGSRP